MAPSSLDLFEARLAEAARRHTDALADTLVRPGAERAVALASTLLRLGFPLGDLETLRTAPSALPLATLQRMRAALATDLGFQLRSARGRRPSYDLNRHIAVVRAVSALEDIFATPAAMLDAPRRPARA